MIPHGGHELIAAPATPTGGALAVVRLSGEGAIAAATGFSRGRRPLSDAPAGSVRFGTICDGERMVDEVLVTLFRAPHSYTGEEMVEISCHGSAYIVSEILRLARPRGGSSRTGGGVHGPGIPGGSSRSFPGRGGCRPYRLRLGPPRTPWPRIRCGAVTPTRLPRCEASCCD